VLETNDYIVAAMVEEGVVDRASVDRAKDLATRQRISVCEALVSQGSVTRQAVAITRATLIECLYVNLNDFDIDIRNARLLPRALAERHGAFPLFDLSGVMTLGMGDPLDLSAVDQIRALLRAEIEPVLCEPEALAALIERAYSMTSEVAGSAPTVSERQEELLTGEEPIVAAVNQILAQAVQDGASDIHINPDEKDLYLRYRIDGMLRSRHGPPRSAHSGIVQRLKVLSSLDLTQSRRPQDGKFRFMHEQKPIDVRVSVIPTIHGENVVMRILASGLSIRSFTDLGLSADHCTGLDDIMESPHGIFLVTGPTGSGKTTTLYTALKKVNTPDRNVMTIEDPVEIRLPMVRQVQVNTEIGLTFAAALRAILRQDPDIVLLGEIRDQETARIALQAALTGHLVLATLHTNDAPGAISRLRDLECPSFAINASLLGVLAQRLVKKVCQVCARPHTPAPSILRRLSIEPGGLVKGAGCPACMTTGYKGRLVVAELLTVGSEIQNLIETEAGTADLRREAVRLGMKPMWRDGVEKAQLGQTTVEEVVRVIAVDLEGESARRITPIQEQSSELRKSA